MCASNASMLAWVLPAPGGPEAFEQRRIPVPEVGPGRVLLRVRAFGLNRSEWFTRRGDSPTVVLPRVLGIECVGEVVRDGDGQWSAGQKVAAMMGGMGREYDGSYAELTCVPSASVFPLETTLDWATLGALPEMLQTTHGSLHVGLELARGQTLLIRGGTSSVGLMAVAMGRALGARILATTRSMDRRDMLLDAGASEVLVDDGSLAQQIEALHPGGVDRVLELIGTSTLLDSLCCARPGGVVCMTGILGGQWELQSFRPMGQIPTGVRLTSYSGGAADIDRETLQRYVTLVERGELRPPLGPTWGFDQLPDAHRAMDENRARGKMVVTLG